MSVTPAGAVHFSPRKLDFSAQSCAIFNNSGTAALRRASVTHRAAFTAFASASLLRSASATVALSRAPSSCVPTSLARSASLSCPDRRFGPPGSHRAYLMMSQVRSTEPATSNTDWTIAPDLRRKSMALRHERSHAQPSPRGLTRGQLMFDLGRKQTLASCHCGRGNSSASNLARHSPSMMPSMRSGRNRRWKAITAFCGSATS